LDSFASQDEDLENLDPIEDITPKINLDDKGKEVDDDEPSTSSTSNPVKPTSKLLINDKQFPLLNQSTQENFFGQKKLQTNIQNNSSNPELKYVGQSPGLKYKKNETITIQTNNQEKK